MKRDDSIITELNEETGEWEIVEPLGKEEESLERLIDLMDEEETGEQFAEDDHDASSFDELFQIGSGRNRAILAALGNELKKKRLI